MGIAWVLSLLLFKSWSVATRTHEVQEVWVPALFFGTADYGVLTGSRQLRASGLDG